MPMKLLVAFVVAELLSGVRYQVQSKHGIGEQKMANEKPMPKHPCKGCVYFKVCGESTRTAPCYGRMTKRERKADDGK